jgi:integrase
MNSLFVNYSLKFNRKNKLNSNGEALIQIRMYLNGQTRFYSTEVYVQPSEWNEKKSVPKSPHLQRKISQLIHELETFEADYRKEHHSFKLINFDGFGKPIEDATPINTSFTTFMVAQHEAEKVLNQPSWRDRKLTITLFKEYKPEAEFSEVNYDLIEGFEFFLHTKKLHTNTIAKHHKHLKKYIIRAIKGDFINHKSNPYTNFKVKKQESKSEFLTSEELERFEKLSFDKTQSFDEKVRDMFLFGIYTGLRFRGVYNLKASDFIEDSDGLILDFKAGKTNKFGLKYLGILFGGKPEIIAKKYMPLDDKITLFKGCTNPKVNKKLKVLAKRAKIAKALCFKDSRDTFGTQLISKTDARTVQYEMQHSSLRQTQKYLHLSTEMKKQELSKIKW